MKSVIIYITTKDFNEAEKIGESVVKEKLAACANIIPEIKSIYWWKGKIETGEEAVLILKTKQDLVEDLIKKVKEMHSYEVPVIDVIPVIEGNKECFEWIEEVTK